jgi:hypothetical protein
MKTEVTVIQIGKAFKSQQTVKGDLKSQARRIDLLAQR